MIIRQLRPDENVKAFEVRSIGYGFSIDIKEESKKELKDEVIGAFLDDNETLVAIVYILEYKNNYCGNVVPCLGIGGIATRPEYRRFGAVRKIMEKILSMAPERGWVTSFLHPFSYDYYRKFGYERLVKRIKIKVADTAFMVCERNTNAKLYSYKNPELLKDILQVYNTYALRYSSMLIRDECTDAYSLDPYTSRQHTYVHYSDEGKPDAIATVEVFDEDKINISEICYVDANGLRGMLGFLRMFDGQVNEFCFNNLPETSEIDYILHEYTKMQYSIDSRAMGRVLLVEEALKQNIYPKEYGHFRLKSEDVLLFNNAVFDVEYKDGKATVKKLSADAEFDISCTVPPLSRFMLGGGFSADTASYLDGVNLKGDASDFFRAFPDRNLFIHDFF